jgi:hypothetical protein
VSKKHERVVREGELRAVPKAQFTQGAASLTDESPKAPTKLSVTEGTAHKVKKMGDGRFMAYWNRRVVYQNGRIKRFETSEDALAFLARCDAAGRIIH